MNITTRYNINTSMLSAVYVTYNTLEQICMGIRDDICIPMCTADTDADHPARRLHHLCGQLLTIMSQRYQLYYQSVRESIRVQGRDVSLRVNGNTIIYDGTLDYLAEHDQRVRDIDQHIAAYSQINNFMERHMPGSELIESYDRLLARWVKLSGLDKSNIVKNIMEQLGVLDIMVTEQQIRDANHQQPVAPGQDAIRKPTGSPRNMVEVMDRIRYNGYIDGAAQVASNAAIKLEQRGHNIDMISWIVDWDPDVVRRWIGDHYTLIDQSDDNKQQGCPACDRAEGEGRMAGIKAKRKDIVSRLHSIGCDTDYIADVLGMDLAIIKDMIGETEDSI